MARDILHPDYAGTVDGLIAILQRAKAAGAYYVSVKSEGGGVVAETVPDPCSKAGRPIVILR